jgi:hypothetical protein
VDRIEEVVRDRHPATQHFAKVFAYDHLPEPMRSTSKLCHDLAVRMIQRLDDGPELSAGLRKLREAKDCFVLQQVFDGKG